MGRITEILQDTYEWAEDLKNAPDNNCIERAQYSYQTWILKQMLKVANAISRQKQKTK
ncbi:MAG: hypothetical protein IJD69_01825 [Alphaproteobacteria bacterium]|nr:hypothetical protein [Alphaproteobacteria bacterium]MBQ8367951.1 hypothetical protein [Alphaproteobacteria bacterium]MBR5566618.1 hypothetical protein [Alphaproteobacteria bacterium]